MKIPTISDVYQHEWTNSHIMTNVVQTKAKEESHYDSSLQKIIGYNNVRGSVYEVSNQSEQRLLNLITQSHTYVYQRI